MFNPLSRVYSIVHTGAVVATIALILNFYSGVAMLDPEHVSGGVQHVKTHELTLDKSKNDRALLQMRLNYDLRGCFNWSTDTVFLYVTAIYESNRHARNEVVVYDKILTNAREAFQPGVEVFAKYYLLDHGRSLRNKTVSLNLFYELVPIGGHIRQYKLGDHKFRLPSEYVSHV